MKTTTKTSKRTPKAVVHFFFEGPDGLSGAYCAYGFDDATASSVGPSTKDESKVTCRACLADLAANKSEAKGDAF